MKSGSNYSWGFEDGEERSITIREPPGLGRVTEKKHRQQLTRGKSFPAFLQPRRGKRPSTLNAREKEMAGICEGREGEIPYLEGIPL